MKNLSLKVSLLVLTLLMGAVVSFAQSDVVLSGVITDTGGEPLPGASVTLLETKTPFGVISDVDGKFSITWPRPTHWSRFPFLALSRRHSE